MAEKITIKSKNNKKVSFESLKCGDRFLYKGYPYYKTNTHVGMAFIEKMGKPPLYFKNHEEYVVSHLERYRTPVNAENIKRMIENYRFRKILPLKPSTKVTLINKIEVKLHT